MSAIPTSPDGSAEPVVVAVPMEELGIEHDWHTSGLLSQRHLRNDSGVIMRRVEQGERFTVTRNGVPVADLVPHDRAAADQRRRFVPVARVAAGVSQLPDWEV